MYFRMVILFVCAILLSTTTDVVQGRYVFRRNIHGWLQAHKVIATWEEAQQQCQSEGAVLASPIRVNLLAEMKLIMQLNHHSTPYFIGTKMRKHPGTYVSEEGVPIDDMPVAEMLERVDAGEGDCLSMDGYSINVVPCSTQLPYICYHNTTYCGTGYNFVSSTGSCYKKHTSKKSWDVAEATCIAEGGHLVVINNGYEAQIIKNIGIPSYPFLFVGVRFDQEGDEYISIHGDRLEEIYNEKRSSCGRSGCLVATNEAAHLDNYSCEGEREFICEKDPDNVRKSPRIP